MAEQNEKNTQKKIDVVSLHGKNTDVHIFNNEGKIQIQIDKTFLNGKKPKVIELMTIEKEAWTDLNLKVMHILFPKEQTDIN